MVTDNEDTRGDRPPIGRFLLLFAALLAAAIGLAELSSAAAAPQPSALSDAGALTTAQDPYQPRQEKTP